MSEPEHTRLAITHPTSTLSANALPIAFLIFGALVIGMEIVVLYQKNQGFGPQAVRIVGLTIVLTIAAALSSTQLGLERLTPLIGLLGTLAGYLAGRGEDTP